MPHAIGLRFLSVLVLILLPAVNSLAQTRGGISGTVTDSRHAPIADAPVTVANLAAGVVRSVRTNGGGRFSLSDLDAGTYEIVVEVGGFSVGKREVTVAGDAVELPPIRLHPGAIREVVTVSAQRSDRDVLATPEAVSVVDARQLQERLPGTAADILRDLPGTNTQSQGFLTRPMIRGLEGNRVLVLVDGERLNNSRTPTSHIGNGVETGLVDVGSLDRVEVVRGAGSVLYGTEALGGTINFITRPPAFPDKTPRASGQFDPFVTTNGWGLDILGKIVVGRGEKI